MDYDLIIGTTYNPERCTSKLGQSAHKTKRNGSCESYKESGGRTPTNRKPQVTHLNPSVSLL
jgi:hypothetical protein